MSQVVLITTCTRRKRALPNENAHFRKIPRGEVNAAAQQWLERLSSLGSTTRADQLYSGRAFAEARRAADHLNAPLKIVSAGLGLIDAESEVPSYEATIALGSLDSISSHLNVTPEQWWAALKQCRRFQWPSDEALLLVAASGPYLRMIEQDLLTLPINRLRIFTRTQTGALPPALRAAVMPYDSRLDAGNGRPGTIADFAQRALAHFAEYILPCAPMGDLNEHTRLVLSHLGPLVSPTKRVGRKATDDEIRTAISIHYDSVGGQSSQMLRKLRDELGIACEQSRFRDLFKGVAQGGLVRATCLPL